MLYIFHGEMATIDDRLRIVLECLSDYEKMQIEADLYAVIQTIQNHEPKPAFLVHDPLINSALEFLSRGSEITRGYLSDGFIRLLGATVSSLIAVVAKETADFQSHIPHGFLGPQQPPITRCNPVLSTYAVPAEEQDGVTHFKELIGSHAQYRPVKIAVPTPHMSGCIQSALGRLPMELLPLVDLRIPAIRRLVADIEVHSRNAHKQQWGRGRRPFALTGTLIQKLREALHQMSSDILR